MANMFLIIKVTAVVFEVPEYMFYWSKKYGISKTNAGPYFKANFSGGEVIITDLNKVRQYSYINRVDAVDLFTHHNIIYGRCVSEM